MKRAAVFVIAIAGGVVGAQLSCGSEGETAGPSVEPPTSTGGSGGIAGAGGTAVGGSGGAGGGGAGGIGGEGGQGGEVLGPPCSGYGTGVEAGAIDNLLLYELSGVTASQRNADVLWTHNDGGGSGLFAIGTDAAYLGAYHLPDLELHDWEDIAVGPGPQPGTTYVYVGDHGNNGRDRQTVWVHRVPEPEVTAGPVFNLDLTGGETFLLEYADERHDVETLLVDPATGDIYLVTKAYEGPTIVFRAAAPLVDGQVVILEQVNTIDLGVNPELNLATGGDVSPSGDRIVVRTKLTAFVWDRPPGSDFWEAFDAEPCIVPLQLEWTGEAVGFAADGVSFYTTSEWLYPPLYFYEYSR